MPLLGLMHLLIGIGFAVHSQRTGRPQFWLWILLFIPFAGSIAYVLFELLPELGQTRRAQKVKGGISDLIAPDREWHARKADAVMRDTPETKRALAEECERKGMWEDAIELYQLAAQGIYADDVTLLLSLARAQLGGAKPQDALATLDRLQAAHPDIKSQEGHLLYARALEDLGRIDEAMGEYADLMGYYTGLEARTRFGLLLTKRGELAKGRALFEDVVRASQVRGVVMTDKDRDWLKVAKANL